MSDYDFHQLTYHDLEILTRDLLQAHWGVMFESFKSGRDQGIDLRYAAGPNKVIVQVKHYLRTGLDGLLQEVKKEAEKVQKLNPTRYVLVTTVPLSPADKDKIIKIIGAEFISTGDVLGPAELNNMLGQHSEIENKHFKLWLASTNVLNRVLHNAEVTRSIFKVRQVHKQARRYVMSDAYDQALKKLDKERVAIVTGAPGVGKTTLADLVLYAHLEKGYQVVTIQRDVDEGEKLFREGEKQIFFFDDFMGATFLGDRGKLSAAPNDQALLNFISMVRETPTARLILTTRAHIYSRAMERSEKLQSSDLDDMRIFLHMPSYSPTQRAYILYNHLYFSDLPEEYISELLRDQFYLEIVKHKQFNPRLIEWLSNYRRVRQVEVNDYRSFVEALLRDPSAIWRHAYENELSDAGRSLLLTIYSLEGRADGSRLRRDFGELHAVMASRYSFPSAPEDFRSAMKEAANVFIRPVGQDGFEVIDPSVMDLMNAVIRTAPDNAVNVITGSTSFVQVERVWALSKEQGGAPVVQAIKDNAAKLAPVVSALAMAERRVDGSQGSYSLYGPSYEHRLGVVVEMFKQTGAAPFAEIVRPLFIHLLKSWDVDSPDINDGVELMKMIEGLENLPEATQMLTTIRSALIGESQTGCRSDELRELITVIDTSSVTTQDAIAARLAFEQFRGFRFRMDLDGCRSTAQFDDLIEDLEWFKDQLRVDVESMIEQVEDSRQEHEENEERYADSMHDEWKERGREERATDRSISEIFGSLKGGRS